MGDMPTVLESIVTARRGHLADIQRRIAHVDPATLAASTRSLYDSLGSRGEGRFIMECKSASPSLGLIRADYHPGDIARIYSRYAAGISVLCEPDRFGGDYDHLATVAASTHLPVLCKDFIIDAVQIHAARYFGADAVLLMLSVLDDEEYSALSAEATRLGMDVLTEAIDAEEVHRALRLGARIIGINHRNLHDLSIDLGRTAELAPLVPEDVALIAESGIRDHATVRMLGGMVNGFLVGSQLTSRPDVDLACRELVYGHNKVCGLRSPAAAQAARAAGAVYGGLIFEDASPRDVSRETSKEIMAGEPGLKYVAVSRRTSGYAELCLPGITVVQIHAPLQDTIDQEKALIASVRAEIPEGVGVWRAVSMSSPQSVSVALELFPLVDRLVLDAGDGGTGKPFDWSLIPDEVTSTSLLAGGIGPTNARAALAVGCAGLDLNSGVEYPADADNPYAYRKNPAAIMDVFQQIGEHHA